MEIQVGEYIRTDKGNIGKLVEIRCGKSEDGEKLIDVYFLDNGIWTLKKYIVKHSFELIDLIEKDDYINGCRVYEVEERGITVYQKVENSDIDYSWIPKDEIENVVTKEAFESIKYLVEKV